MESGKYEKIDRKFLDTFYRECGRETTLAYTVLNQTNTWALTFFAAIMSSSLIGLVKHDPPGEYSFDYPNPFHWLYLILAWGLLLRFMQRSVLALSNMYRWNELGTAVWEIAALPENHPGVSRLNDALVELVDRLVMRWREPRSRMSLLWATLKLLYLGPVLVLVALLTWGLISLPRNPVYWGGLSTLVAWTLLEAGFFINWNKSPRQALRGDKASEFLRLFRIATSTADDDLDAKERTVSGAKQCDTAAISTDGTQRSKSSSDDDQTTFDFFKLAVETRNFEIGLFWQRSNYFLVLNSGLALGYFTLKDSITRLAFTIFGTLASSLWFRVCLGSKYWQTRWEQRLARYEKKFYPDLNFYAASPERRDKDVSDGLELIGRRGVSRVIYTMVGSKPSVSFSMILLAVLFSAAWAIMAMSAIWEMLHPWILRVQSSH